MTMTLGEKLRKHRDDKGYSLDQLAKLSNTSKSYLWELENRSERKPSGEKLARIAQFLEITSDYLLDDKAQPDEEMAKTAFFRKFNNLEEDDQKKISDMIDMWRKKD